MHCLNTILLRFVPNHFSCKFKRKRLIFYSIIRTYSEQEPSISSPMTELHVLYPNTKIILRVGIMKDKTFILLKQECLRHSVILFLDILFCRLCHESHIDRLACAQSKDIIHPTRFLRIKTWQRPWLPFPAGILRIPVFSVLVALFPQESGFLVRRNIYFTPSGILSVPGLRT